MGRADLTSIDINGQKVFNCKGCRKNYPLTAEFFYRNPGNTTGFFSKCKKCANSVNEINAVKQQKFLEENLWTCSTCDRTLLLNKDNFYKRSDSKTGFQFRCKQCMKKDPGRCKRLINNGDLNYFLHERYIGCRSRSRKKKLDFNISEEDIKDLWIKQNGLCAISGIKMNHSVLKGKVKTNLSVDRIDPLLGYIKGNIQLVCNIVNIMKSNMPTKDLIFFCKQIIKYNDE